MQHVDEKNGDESLRVGMHCYVLNQLGNLSAELPLCSTLITSHIILITHK